MLGIDGSALIEALFTTNRTDLKYITATSFARSFLALTLFAWFQLDRGERRTIDNVKKFRIFLPWILPSSSDEWCQAIASFLLVLCRTTLGTWRVAYRTSLLNDIDAAIDASKSPNGLFYKALRFSIVELAFGRGIILIKDVMWQKFTSSREARARKIIFSILMHQDADFHSSRETHISEWAVGRGLEILKALDRLFFDMIPNALQLLFAARTMQSSYGFNITLTVACVRIIILVAAIRKEKGMMPLEQATIQAAMRLTRIRHNVLRAFDTVSQCGQIDREIKDYSAAEESWKTIALKRITVDCEGSFIMGLVQSLGSFVCLWQVVMHSFQVKARATSVVDFIDYERQVGEALSFFGDIYTKLYKLENANALYEILATPSMAFGGETLRNPGGVIRFSDVCYTYPGEKTPIFNNLSVTIEQGRLTAILGANAVGKTTLLNLLGRLLPVQGGRVTIGGQPIDELREEELRGLISYVPQRPHIFPGTIMDNIKYGQPEASLQDVQDAADDAGIHPDIKKMPLQYDTMTGEGKLSGGQVQRIALARALLRRTKVLVVDEPTSALDQDLKRRIVSALRRYGGTVVMVTHDIRIAQKADRIIVLKRGPMGTKVAESGSHADLRVKHGEYARLCHP